MKIKTPKFIKQYKGTDIIRATKKNLKDDLYFASKKYDGNYMQIQCIGNQVVCYTSDGKELRYDGNLKDHLIRLTMDLDIDFVVEAEYIAGTNGMMGSRGQCTTTSVRVKTAKGIVNNAIQENSLKVFDILYYRLDENVLYHCEDTRDNYEERRSYEELIPILNNDFMEFVKAETLTLGEAKIKSAKLISEGWEGLFLFHHTHTWSNKGRSQLALKLKEYPKKTMLIVDVKEGEGKYIGVIGSLQLKDKEGNLVWVGSGLSDYHRTQVPMYYIGNKVDIHYESFKDTYIQPRFIKESLDRIQ